jgi:hypothetical protein
MSTLLRNTENTEEGAENDKLTENTEEEGRT